ncbi:hypothetical protein ACQKP0_04555 [Heyndrickxia sp. NPDC080065]|uniref:hypothetical protein n=1 Tax=Heyndrickxia sp. NPDC080065 TaxID=3390568 RepID=UPI003D02474D
MNQINKSDINRVLEKQLKHRNSSVSFDQVWDKYSSESMDQGTTISKKILKTKPRPVWIMAIVLFFIASFSVSAAIIPFDWNGIKISILDDNGKNDRIDSFKELIFGYQPTYKHLIDTLEHSKNMKKTLTLEEAKKEFPFPILRPEHTNMVPSRSIGALMNHTLQENNGPEKIVGYNPVFHDFYNYDSHWIVVTQSLDEAATNSLKEDPNHMSSQTYVGNWETVQVSDQTLAMYKGGDKENRLLLQYKTDDMKVIELELIGNVEKKDLVKLAEAYVGK